MPELKWDLTATSLRPSALMIGTALLMLFFFWMKGWMAWPRKTETLADLRVAPARTPKAGLSTPRHPERRAVRVKGSQNTKNMACANTLRILRSFRFPPHTHPRSG